MYIPKLEPFSRTKFERGVKEPPLIRKCENELAGTYTILETYEDLWILEKDFETVFEVDFLE